MSILDDAIREHLELKRQHGADDAELKKLEDEAFGPPARPESDLDPFAEAPTEFLVAPGAEAREDEDTARGGDFDDEGAGGRRINVADLQEPPPPSPESDEAEALADEAPAEEEHPAMEHEAVTESADDAEPGHNTEERHAIAEQPTEMFDIDAELAAGSGSDSPSDEQLLDAELNDEPRLAPVDPIEGIEASAAAAPPSDEEIEEHADEFDEFFSEQRLSDELNQALEAPVEDEPAFPPTEETEAPPPPPESEEATAIHPVQEPQQTFAEEEEAQGGLADEEKPGEEDDHPASQHETDHQDALEETPEFLADDPEDENLWFEQKPPKDIDFGD
jgi:hypothetical protein